MRAYFNQLIQTVSRTEKRLYYRDQTPDTLMALVELAEECQPTKIVELGTLSGMSLRAWVKARTSAQIVAVDLSFKALQDSLRILPFDLSRVRCVEGDIFKVDFRSLWSGNDRVILYIDAHDEVGVPLMDHILCHVLPHLPDGSTVAVDDVWYSSEAIRHDSADACYRKVIVPQFDPLIYRVLSYAPYWKGGSFAGFLEVIPLVRWVDEHAVDVQINPSIKMVSFKYDSLCSKRTNVSFNAKEFQEGVGEIHPDVFPAILDANRKNGISSDRLAQFKKGTAFFRQDKYSEAFSVFQVIMMQKADFWGIEYALAVCLVRLGEFDAAINILRVDVNKPDFYPNTAGLLNDLSTWLKMNNRMA